MKTKSIIFNKHFNTLKNGLGIEEEWVCLWDDNMSEDSYDPFVNFEIKEIDDMINSLGSLIPRIEHNFNNGYYNWSENRISLPLQGQFNSREMFYRTKMHEIFHSFGRGCVLNRKSFVEYDEVNERRNNFLKNSDFFTAVFSNERFDHDRSLSIAYHKEEVVVEFGVYLLFEHLGLMTDELRHSLIMYIRRSYNGFGADMAYLKSACLESKRMVEFFLEESKKAKEVKSLEFSL